MTNDSLALLEACPESMILVRQGVPEAWNSLACRMLEWSSTVAGVDKVWVPEGGLFRLEGDEVGLFESKYDRLLKGKAAKMRCTIVRQTGSTFEGEWKAVPVEEGVFMLQIRDISERMVYEQVIRESEQRFRSLARHAMEGIAFLDGTTVVDANEQFAILFGLKEIPVGEDILNLVNPRDWQRLGARKYARSRVELQGITAQGKAIHLEATRSIDSTTNQAVLMVYDITERKRTELDLLQTKERFRMLVETSPIGLMLMVDGKIKYSNPGVLDLLGIRLEDDIYDEPLLSLFHEDDQPVLREDVSMVEQGERPPYREVRLMSPSGEVVSVGIRMTLSFHDRSPAVQITLSDLRTRVALMKEQMRAALAEESNVLLTQEIERHKRTQTLLQTAERFNRSIIESSIDMIVAVNHEGRLVQFNQAFAIQFGLPDGCEPSEYDFTDYSADPSQIEGIYDSLNDALSFTGEVHARRLNGETFPVLLTIAVMHSENDEPPGAMAVIRDITEARLAQEELEASEARYRNILDNASDVIFTVDDQGFFTYTNPSFNTVLGYSEVELSKRTIHDVVEGLSKRGKTWIRSLEGERKEQRFVSASGKVLTMLGGASVQHNDAGKPTGIRGIFLDITERKEIDRAIRSALKEKEVLLQEVHHRVKNNLQVISSMLNLQKSFVKDPETLNLLEESTNRIATMSFIHESLYRTTNFANISFAEYLQRLSANLVQSYSQSQCEVTLQTVFDEIFISLDQAIPCGLITNELVTNALKYAFPDRECGIITVRFAHIEGGAVELEVADDGVGLPAGMDFAKNDSLGVYLVQALTEQIDGELVVTSTDQSRKGCSFLVRFTPTE